MADNTLALTKKQIVSLQQTLEADIDVVDTISYTDDQIEKLLKKLPVLAFQAATNIVNTLVDFKEAKRMLRKTMAQQMMIARQNTELTAVGDRKAWAENTPEVEAAEIDLIKAEAEYRAAEFHYQAYDNLFTAVKKLSTMRIEQNKAQAAADR